MELKIPQLPKINSNELTPTEKQLLAYVMQLKESLEFWATRIGHDNINFGDMLDQYGIDPKYLFPYKNLCRNSQFELYDSSNSPTYWNGTGTVSTDSSFDGTVSCKLNTGQYIESNFTVNPTWYGSYRTRVSFMKKFGKVKLEILDASNNDAPFLLTDVNGNTAPYKIFEYNKDWSYLVGDNFVYNSCTVTFVPGKSISIKIKITNVDDKKEVYIDTVNIHPDFTYHHALYKDGPRSTGYKGSEVKSIFVLTKAQRAAKTDFEDKDVTIVTDDPTRHDIILKSTTTTLTAEESESVILCDGTFTVNLPTAVGNDEISYTIKNKGAGTITIDPSGTETIDGAATKTLAANEKAKIISDGSNWWVI